MNMQASSNGQEASVYRGHCVDDLARAKLIQRRIEDCGLVFPKKLAKSLNKSGIVNQKW
jgi:hypothetical protein